MTALARFLRPALFADAASSGGMGLLLAVAAEPLAPLLGLPPALLRPAGLVLLPFAVFVAFVALRAFDRPAAVWAIVLVNAAWVAGSFAMLASSALQPTGLGILFVAAQALAVGGLTIVQALAMRGPGSSRGVTA